MKSAFVNAVIFFKCFQSSDTFKIFKLFPTAYEFSCLKLANNPVRFSVHNESVELSESRSTFIRVPEDKPFTLSLKNCKNIPAGEKACKNLVDVDTFVSRAMHIILNELPLEDSLDGSHRKRPILVSRLSRGGKTTCMRELFDAIQKSTLGNQTIRTMIISFNGSSDYYPQENETQIEAILRVIAKQLIDCTEDESELLKVDKDKLDAYIGNEPFVLLIDEINQVTVSPHNPHLAMEASRLLKRMFLKKNRFLVMTTHVPLSLGPIADPSSRGWKTVELPQSSNVSVLRNMSQSCASLTQLEAALYGNVPSLIYCVMTGNENFVNRFRRSGIRSSIRGLDSKNREKLFSDLVYEMISGEALYADASDDDAVVAVHRKLYQFASWSSSDRVSWPLCYMMLILGVFQFQGPLGNILKGLLDVLERLSKEAVESPSGIEWEDILLLGLLLKLIDLNTSENPSYPFSVAPEGIRADIKFIYLPSEIVTISEALIYVSNTLNDCTKPTVTLVKPRSKSFEVYDMFLIYTSGKNALTARLGDAQSEGIKVYDVGSKKHPSKRKGTESANIVGIQAKLGRAGPRNEPSPIVNGGSYVARGISAADSYNSTRGWYYMSEDDIKELLGHSLSLWSPSIWYNSTSIPIMKIDDF